MGKIEKLAVNSTLSELEGGAVNGGRSIEHTDGICKQFLFYQCRSVWFLTSLKASLRRGVQHDHADGWSVLLAIHFVIHYL